MHMAMKSFAILLVLSLVASASAFSIIEQIQNIFKREVSTTSYVAWAPWSDWTTCSATCGGGTRSRTHVCPRYGGCQGDSSEKGACNEFACPTWSNWGDWTDCSATCGGGSQLRTRSCSSYNLCPGNKTQTQDCNKTPCCTTWTDWSTCSATCGAGNQTRTRRCGAGANYGKTSYASKVETETQKCGTYIPCAVWSTWSDWGTCSATCGSGTQTKTRTCTIDGQCTGSGTDSQACNIEACPQWDSWKDWSDCSASCAGGTRQRNRDCLIDTAYCTSNHLDTGACVCDGNTADVTDCNTHLCASWADWGGYSNCSVGCGGGTKTRTRDCNADATFCSTNPGDATCKCEGADSNSTDCNTFKCAQWSEWGQTYSTCSASCGGGTQSQKRTCNNDPTYCVGSNLQDPACQCPGNDTNTQACNAFACPVLADWGDWGTCSVTCGGGTQTRSRACTTDSTYCTADNSAQAVCSCPGNTTDTQACQPDACPVWLAWGEWSACSVTCSNGTQLRHRTCSRTDAPCVDGTDTDVKSCDKGPCYQWSSWGSWSSCSVVCGGGNQTRARKCPVDGGCPGLLSDSSICNQIPCPDWGAWSEWASCSVTCGGGQRARTRSCPLKNACKPGSPFEVDPSKCNTDTCPSWTEWTSWSTCSASCGEGNRRRSRTCTPIADGCPGRNEDVDPCSATPCPPVIPLSPWSDCSRTCGGGQKTRSRTTCPEGPPKCSIEDETAPCNEDTCPKWDPWTSWSDCSKTCGGGQRTRARTCPVVNGCVGQAKEIDPKSCSDFSCVNTS